VKVASSWAHNPQGSGVGRCPAHPVGVRHRDLPALQKLPSRDPRARGSHDTRLLDDDDAPWPGKVHVVLAERPDREHRVAIAPDATDADLGGALRQVIARELANT
jgi:hypothetical protein